VIAQHNPGRSLRVVAALTVPCLLSAVTAFTAVTGSFVGVAAGAAATFFMWCAVRWRFGVAAVILAGCTDGFIKLMRGSTPTYFFKDITLLFAVAGLIGALALHTEPFPKRVPWKRLVPWAMLAFFIIALVFLPGASVASNLAGAHNRLFFSLLMLVAPFYFDSFTRLRNLLVVGIAGITFAALAGVSQSIVPDAWASISTGHASQMRFWYFGVGADGPEFAHRVYGTLVDPGALGLACAFGFILALVLQTTWKTGRAKFFGVVAMVSMAAGLIFSGARAGFIGVLAGVFAICVSMMFSRSTRKFGRSILFLGLFAIVVAFALRPSTISRYFSSEGRAYATESRYNDIQHVIDAAPTHPLGMGLNASGGAGNTIQTSDQAMQVDNLYFAYLYTLGWAGIPLLLGMHLFILSCTLKVYRRARTIELRLIALGIGGAHISLLVAGAATQGAFDQAPMAQLFWLLSGAMIFPGRILESEQILQQRVPRQGVVV